MAKCAFGILSNKWWIFPRCLDVNTDFAVEIIKATYILHNFLRRKDVLQFEDAL